MNKPEISIIAPCFNEEGNIKALYERIESALKNSKFELIYINDGSTDSTEKEILDLAKQDDRVRIVSHNENIGIHQSWLTGVKAANSEVVCLIDADLQNPPEAISDMYRVYDVQQADIVQGTRSSIGRIKDQRMLFSRTLNLLLNLIFFQNCKDSKSGFILGSRSAVENSITTKRKFKYFQTYCIWWKYY
jgi:phenylacetate-CoA ligase